MTRVTVRNNIYQHVQVLKNNRKKRSQYCEFVVEGVRNINEAVKMVSCAASIMMYEVVRQRKIQLK